MLKFWKWLARFAEEQHHRYYFKRHSYDAKCMNCKRWYSFTDSHRNFEPMVGIGTGEGESWRNFPVDRCKCNNCGHVNYEQREFMAVWVIPVEHVILNETKKAA
jgi:hypothetical protein